MVSMSMRAWESGTQDYEQAKGNAKRQNATWNVEYRSMVLELPNFVSIGVGECEMKR